MGRILLPHKVHLTVPALPHHLDQIKVLQLDPLPPLTQKPPLPTRKLVTRRLGLGVRQRSRRNSVLKLRVPVDPSNHIRSRSLVKVLKELARRRRFLESFLLSSRRRSRRHNSRVVSPC